MADQSYDLGPYTHTGHYTLLHRIVEAIHRSPGWNRPALEFGVGAGESTRIIANRIHVHGFDSFKGLPEDWREGYLTGHFAQDFIPIIDNSTMHVGLFADTLADFVMPSNLALIHIDCDLYSSTKTVLDWLKYYPLHDVAIVFDEWFGYEGCEDHEQKAWREFADETGVEWDVLGHSYQQWAICVR